MMKNSWAIVLCAAAMTLWGVGCASSGDGGAGEAAQPRLTEIESSASESVAAIGKEAGEKLLKALQNNDFAAAADLPVGDDKDKLTQARFDEVVQKVIVANGGIRSFAYLADLNVPPCRLLLWKVTFQPKPAADGKEVAAEAGADMVFELWMGKLDGQYKIVAFRFKI